MRHNSGLKHSFLFMQLQFPSLNYSDPSAPQQCEATVSVHSILNQNGASEKFSKILIFDKKDTKIIDWEKNIIRRKLIQFHTKNHFHIKRIYYFIKKFSCINLNVELSVRNCPATLLGEIKNELLISNELMMLVIRKCTFNSKRFKILKLLISECQFDNHILI